MKKKNDTASFNASARGRFTESGAWLIAPRLWLHDDLDTGERAAVQGVARDELLGRVLDEALRGQRLGAERVHVVSESGERVPVTGPEDPSTEGKL